MKQKRKKRHDKVHYLARNKLDCIEMLISQSIMDLNINQDEFKMIMNEKEDYDNQKNNIINKTLTENVQV